MLVNSWMVLAAVLTLGAPVSIQGVRLKSFNQSMSEHPLSLLEAEAGHTSADCRFYPVWKRRFGTNAKLAGYKVKKCLGAGAQGEVWLVDGAVLKIIYGNDKRSVERGCRFARGVYAREPEHFVNCLKVGSEELDMPSNDASLPPQLRRGNGQSKLTVHYYIQSLAPGSELSKSFQKFPRLDDVLELLIDIARITDKITTPTEEDPTEYYHKDAHMDNVFVDTGKITLIDYDFAYMCCNHAYPDATRKCGDLPKCDWNADELRRALTRTAKILFYDLKGMLTGNTHFVGAANWNCERFASQSVTDSYRRHLVDLGDVGTSLIAAGSDECKNSWPPSCPHPMVAWMQKAIAAGSSGSVRRRRSSIRRRRSSTTRRRRSSSTNQKVRFLPIIVSSKRVLVNLGGNKFRVDNTELEASSSTLSYRISKDMSDKDTSNKGPQWGTTVQGTDEGDGWVKVILTTDATTTRRRRSSTTTTRRRRSSTTTTRRRRSSTTTTRRRRSSTSSTLSTHCTPSSARRRRSSTSGRGCCKWGGSCGDCGNDGSGWCHQSSSNCAACSGSFDGSAASPACR